ncbi:unnamed protein product [Pleuronectes platessa]|uniref:Uncharacterized protein n=1 Tax=Pleuronectes platessa TaxID=8262 RepID=A0A9N7YMK9_PLEPL|nr:unnamed protein product [Pleuronectes platessa]
MSRISAREEPGGGEAGDSLPQQSELFPGALTAPSPPGSQQSFHLRLDQRRSLIIQVETQTEREKRKRKEGGGLSPRKERKAGGKEGGGKQGRTTEGSRNKEAGKREADGEKSEGEGERSGCAGGGETKTKERTGEERGRAETEARARIEERGNAMKGGRPDGREYIISSTEPKSREP